MARKRYKPNLFTGVLIFIAAMLLALIIANIDVFRSLELDFLDYRFKLRGSLDISDSPIVIVAIDDQSDESTPHRWPWPREYFARVIDNLGKAGARVIGVDVIFDQADRHGIDSDARFTRSLEKADNVVLAGKILRTTGRLEAMILVPPYHQFTRTNTPWGLVSSEVDADGTYRRYLLAQSHLDSTYSSFAAEVLKIYEGIPKETGIRDEADDFIIGDIVIPKYDSYSMLINYAGPAYSFPVYSFDNILDDADFQLLDEYDLDAFDDPGVPELGIPPGLLHSGVFKDKIVLIGATMQELHDEFTTPFLETTDEEGRRQKAATPGVEVHANALQTILDENYMDVIGIWELLAILAFLGIIVYVATYYLPTLWAALSNGLLITAYAWAGLLLFAHRNLIIEITTPILFIFLAYLGYNLYQYILAQKEKRMIKGAFAHYVPEKVVSEILANPDKLQLGGEERVVTMLFSDAAGFTSISEKMGPSDLVQLLNEYLTEMSEIVLANDGIIDKYEGDAIMAEFGVPVHYDNHAHMACKTAIEMQRRLAELRKKWKKEKKPELKARIGINTGEVIVGNMGARDVFDYTVIGDHVNLASRLEGANKFYGTAILISEYTYERVKDDFYARMLDTIRVKGKQEPILVYELLSSKEETLEKHMLTLLQDFQQGLDHYYARNWSEALHCFEICLKNLPEDPPSLEYCKRCQAYRSHPPPEDWDGVTVLTAK